MNRQLFRNLDNVEKTGTFKDMLQWRKANTSHWGGWVIQSDQEAIYYAGDSGYFRGFKEIGEKFDIEVALLPIGAYEPEWFMSSQPHNTSFAAEFQFRAKLFIFLQTAFA